MKLRCYYKAANLSLNFYIYISRKMSYVTEKIQIELANKKHKMSENLLSKFFSLCIDIK